MTRIAITMAGHTTDELCHMIETRDMSLRHVAEAWGCTKRQVQLWIEADPERHRRAREARMRAAILEERRLQRIMDEFDRAYSPPTAACTAAMRAQVQELQRYYLWRASVRSPAATRILAEG